MKIPPHTKNHEETPMHSNERKYRNGIISQEEVEILARSKIQPNQRFPAKNMSEVKLRFKVPVGNLSMKKQSILLWTIKINDFKGTENSRLKLGSC